MTTKLKFLIPSSIVIFSGLLLLVSFTSAVTVCEEGFVAKSGVCIPSETGLSQASVVDILDKFLSWGLGIFGFFAIIAFVISGIEYLTSRGDEGQITTAKRNMKWSILGVIVGLSGLIIIWAITEALDAVSTTY